MSNLIPGNAKWAKGQPPPTGCKLCDFIRRFVRGTDKTITFRSTDKNGNPAGQQSGACGC